MLFSERRGSVPNWAEIQPTVPKLTSSRTVPIYIQVYYRWLSSHQKGHRKKVSSDTTEFLLSSLQKLPGSGSINWPQAKWCGSLMLKKMEMCLFSKFSMIEASAAIIFCDMKSLVSLKSQACRKAGSANAEIPLEPNPLQMSQDPTVASEEAQHSPCIGNVCGWNSTGKDSGQASGLFTHKVRELKFRFQSLGQWPFTCKGN